MPNHQIDTNAIVGANDVVAPLIDPSRENVGWIVDALRTIVDWMFAFLSLIMDIIIGAVMLFGFNEFQSQLIVTLIIIAFTAWKAGAMAELIDKARWIILFIVAILFIGVITGVIV